MPRAFDRCVSQGGRVRTVHTGKNTCIKVCFKGGKSVGGHTFKCKTAGKKSGAGKKS